MTPSPFDITADLDTPVSAYRKLRAAGFSPRFLLESVEGGERLARYSFLGFGPAMQVRLDARGLVVNNEVAATPATRDDLLAALRAAISRSPRLFPEHPGVPFAGGLVGVTGYDFIRRLERLPTRLPPQPGEPDAAYLGPTSVLVFDHLTRRVALLHSGEQWERRSLRREVIAVLRGAHPPAPTRSGHAPPATSLDADAFGRAVLAAKEHIAAGEVFQLVLSARSSGACATDPFEVYRALRLLNPSSYMYFLDFGDLQVAGSSPEALVRLEGGQSGVASLRPIAGTRRRGETDAADLELERDLLADAKEAAEHVMLVDLARNDLGRVAAPGSVIVEPFRTVERYSHVMHLVSGVRGRLREGADALDLFAATFPAGTVTGAPKIRAMQLIDELEPVRRGIYAGTVGYFGRAADGSVGSMDQAIAIRTLMFHAGRYAYQAGAGIVADSDPQREWAEVRAKVAASEAALKLAEEGL